MNRFAIKLSLVVSSLVLLASACTDEASKGADAGVKDKDAVTADPLDLDGDSVPNNLDHDIDGDGVRNEEDDDVDGDGVVNADDDTAYGDSDGTGPQADPDGDGIPNHDDTDDDGDGIPDGVVGVGEGGTSENDDADGYCVSAEGGYQPCDDGAPPGSGGEDNDNDGLPDPVDPDDDNDGDPDVTDPDDDGQDPPTGECEPLVFNAGSAQAPRIMLVMDRSGSMDDAATGFNGSKWTAAKGAVEDVVQSLNDDVEFGLMMFPHGDGECSAGSVDVDVGPDHADAITSELEAAGTGNGTPTAVTLEAALGAVQQLGTTGGSRAVILATDGGPNCNDELDGDTCRCVGGNCSGNNGQCLDDVNTIAAAQALNDAGFPVFVIGIPGAENFVDVLNNLADAGGTAQAGTTSFYDASSSDDLAGYIEDIAVRVGSCRFDLPRAVVAGDITVTVGGAPVSRDQGRDDGWDLVDSNTIELFGVPCDDAVVDGAEVQVNICEDPPATSG